MLKEKECKQSVSYQEFDFHMGFLFHNPTCKSQHLFSVIFSPRLTKFSHAIL